MGQPITLQAGYAGMARDFSREGLPGGYVWNLQDYIPNLLGAPLRKRGGWVYASCAMGAQTSIQQVATASFTGAGNKLVAIDSASSTSTGPVLWTVNTSTAVATSVGGITSGASTSAGGGSAYPIGNLTFFDGVILIPVQATAVSSAEDTGSVMQYDGTNIQRAGLGIKPNVYGWYSAVYKDRFWVARPQNAQKRLYPTISTTAGSDPTVFSPSSSFIDATHNITGVQGLANALLVFSYEGVERIRGSVPPPGSDMVLEDVSGIGCPDYRSIVTWQNRAIYANTDGVYMTDGAATVDLTGQGFVSNYWRTVLASYTTAWELNAVVFRDYYIISISNGRGGTFQDCLVCDLNKRSWFRFQNFNFRAFAQMTGAFQDLYAACATVGRVARLTDIFTPAAGNKNDADGTAVTPVVEYPSIRGWTRFHRSWRPTQGLTHWQQLFLTHDTRDAATDNPTLQISYVTDPASTSYTAAGATIAETTAQTRVKRGLNTAGDSGKIIPSLGVKIAQTNASSDTRIYALEGEYEVVESSRMAQ